MQVALRFGIVFVPLALLFGWAHQADLFGYDERVRATANTVLERMAPLTVIESDDDGLWRFALVNVFGVPEGFLRVPVQYRFLGIAILPALLLATPTGVPRWTGAPHSFRERAQHGTMQLALRLLLAAVGVLLLWVVDTASTVGWIHAANCARFHPREFFCPSAMWSLTRAGAIYPVILWGLLSRPGRRVPDATTRAT
jgi:hypothetical protein